MKTPAIGIDFGSSHLSAAVLQDGRVDLIQDELGAKTVPNLVAFTRNGVLFGEDAEKQVNIDSKWQFLFLSRVFGFGATGSFVRILTGKRGGWAIFLSLDCSQIQFYPFF